jgi:hypothetical protein
MGLFLLFWNDLTPLYLDISQLNLYCGMHIGKYKQKLLTWLRVQIDLKAKKDENHWSTVNQVQWWICLSVLRKESKKIEPSGELDLL